MDKQFSWYEDPEFWLEYEPVFFNPKRKADAKQDVRDILDLIPLDPEARILDLPCGIGRHTLEFARRGFRTTGVDLTQHYLERARKQATSEKLHSEFIHADMRTFHRDASFDLVTNLLTSFGYFEDQDQDIRVLNNMYRSLKPGGHVILDLKGKEIIARDFKERDTYEVSGIIVIEERKILCNWEWIEIKWTLIKEPRTYEQVMGLRMYSAAELKSLLQDCGFGEVEIFGDFKGACYDNRAKRLVCCAKRP